MKYTPLGCTLGTPCSNCKRSASCAGNTESKNLAGINLMFKPETSLMMVAILGGAFLFMKNANKI